MQSISAPIAPPGAGMVQNIAARLKKTGLKVTIGG